ncbi:hypothetical protein LNO36_13580 [Klebsiella variicola subsp. variicola]|nr:hypothetical protein [Klebsiella variicola subsp. variicola]
MRNIVLNAVQTDVVKDKQKEAVGLVIIFARTVDLIMILASSGLETEYKMRKRAKSLPGYRNKE